MLALGLVVGSLLATVANGQIDDGGSAAPVALQSTEFDASPTELSDESKSLPEPDGEIADSYPINEFTPAQFATDPAGWMARFGFLAIRRGDLNGYPLIDSANGQNNAFDSAVYRFDWSTGIDAAISHRFPGESLFDGWDARYIGAQSDAQPVPFAAQATWTLPGSPVVWPGTNLQLSYNSTLSSAEWNLQRDAGVGQFILLAGVRWLQLKDDLRLLAQFSPDEALRLQVNTSNNLFGGQIGAGVQFWKENTPLTVGAKIKTGLYNDCSTALSQIEQSTAAGFSTWARGGSGNRIAFLGDLELDLIYCVSEHWSTQAGFQLLWLEGVTVAGRQSQVGKVMTDSPAIDHDSDAWFSGLTLGIRFHW